MLYSYRQDPDVPAFPDAAPLFVFDGCCVLCSGGASLLMRHSRQGDINFTPASSPLGRALYEHYRLNANETYLLVCDGSAHLKSDGYLTLCEKLGGWWRLLLFAQMIPRKLRDRVYDTVARNRYRWFGRVDHCQMLTDVQRTRLI